MFDIYGQGGEKDKIEQIVYENNAQEYITLKGHVNLQDVYSKYELFVSASQSEGFWFDIDGGCRVWFRNDRI